MQERRVTANGLRFSVWTAGDGPRLALLLHGFPDDAGSWRPLAARLVAAGYRVAAPQLRGYGRSDRDPQGDYHVAALARDAACLVEALEAERALVVGHDWGAVAAYAAANLAPARFAAVVALSVPPPRTLLRNLKDHPAQLRRSWYMGLFQVPLVARRALRRRNYALIDRLWRSWSPGWEPPPERLAEVKRTFDYPGAVEAALSYYRGLFRPLSPWLVGSYRESWRLARERITVPTLVLAGAEDGCIGADLYRGAGEAFATTHRVDVLPGAGHWLPLEATDRVAERTLEWADPRVGPRPRPAPAKPRRLPVV